LSPSLRVCAILLAAVALLAAPAKKKRRASRPAAPPVSAKARAAALERITEQLKTSEVTFENPGALVPFFEHLYQKGRISILHFGDSHTAADEWTGDLRNLFQSKFGNGGAGFSHAGRPWNSYRRMDVRSYASRNWHTEGLVNREGDGMYGLAGVSISTQLPGEFVSLKAEGTILQINYLQQPGGGSLELTDDNEPLDTIATDGELGPGYYRREMKPGPHVYALRTRDRAPVRLFGWVTGNAEGLTYETLGINGAQASMILNWDGAITASNIADRNPALIVLAYGTNEAGNSNWATENYRDLLVGIIARFRQAAPTASILLVGPPDRFIRVKGKWVPYNAVDRIVAAERQAAATAGCAFLDLRGKLGGKGTMHEWAIAGLAQNDHVHFTAAGYGLIAKTMFQDLMDQYGIFVKAREQ
jgi:lysophospholipase L1-like esterase